MGVEEHVAIKTEQQVGLVWGVGSSPPHPTPPPSGWEGWPRSPMVTVEQTDQDLIMQLAKMVKAGLVGRSLGLTCTPASLF